MTRMMVQNWTGSPFNLKFGTSTAISALLYDALQELGIYFPNVSVKINNSLMPECEFVVGVTVN